MQREDCRGEFQKKKYSNEAKEIASLNMGDRKKYSSINFLGGYIEGISIVNFCCTGHAAMSSERGNYGLITVHAPFLAIGLNQKPLGIVVWKPRVADQR